MESGAQPGNRNAKKGKAFKAALKRALAHKSNATMSAGLDAIAKKLVEAAYEGEQWAMREVMDRIDGRPAQAIIGGDDDDNPVEMVTSIGLVDLAGTDSTPTET